MSIYQYRKFSAGYVIKDILFISLCSAVIAIVFMLVTSVDVTVKIYFEYFLIAQCIGLSIGIPCTFAFHFLKPVRLSSQLILVTICVLLGSILGSFMASRLVHHKFASFQGQIHPQMILVGIILGFIVSFGFVIYEKYISFKLSANEEKLKRTVLEKEKINADLKLLQAQVEPHFLFNTLSNILSLLEHDVGTGKKMLENLTQYLRASLIQSRKSVNLLSDEIDMIRTYLDIYKIRMGERLVYEINLPEDVKRVEIPPMILQPLVENAIKHGLEPKIEGGKISIKASRKEGAITIEVADTGVGIKEKSTVGVGTGNIKKRLDSLFGGRASLNFQDMTPAGLKIIVEIPCEKDYSHYRG